jgi:hypothetical protein
MRYLLIVFFLLLKASFAFAQDDSLIVINTYDYDINYGINRYHRYCPNQKTLNKDAVLMLEITYSKVEKSDNVLINNITRNFYINNRPISNEIYNAQENLEFIKYYKYNEDNTLTQEILISFLTETPSIKSIKKYKYKKGALIQTTLINENKKKVCKTVYSNKEGVELIETSYTKFALEFDSLSKISISKYFTNDTLKNQTAIYYRKNRNDTIKTEFEYNNEGLAVKQTIVKNSQLHEIKVYTFNKNGEVFSESTLNTSNELISFYEYEKTYLIHQIKKVDSALKLNYNKLSKTIKLGESPY